MVDKGPFLTHCSFNPSYNIAVQAWGNNAILEQVMEFHGKIVPKQKEGNLSPLKTGKDQTTTENQFS